MKTTQDVKENILVVASPVGSDAGRRVQDIDAATLTRIAQHVVDDSAFDADLVVGHHLAQHAAQQRVNLYDDGTTIQTSKYQIHH